jgi:hypothetical protein
MTTGVSSTVHTVPLLHHSEPIGSLDVDYHDRLSSRTIAVLAGEWIQCLDPSYHQVRSKWLDGVRGLGWLKLGRMWKPAMYLVFTWMQGS